VADLSGTRDVTVLADAAAKFPGHVALRVIAEPAIDWQTLQKAAAARGIVIEAFAADDVLANVRGVATAERELAPAGDATRRAQWANFAANDRDARVQRALLAHVDAIVGAAPRAGDPRMAELAAIAAAERECWAALATTPVAVRATPANGASDTVRTLLAATPNDGDAATWLRGDGFRRWVAARLAWERVRVLCDGIAADAARKALRTRDGGMAATYRELDAACRDLSGAIALLLAAPW
jgi:hypothetical protein